MERRKGRLQRSCEARWQAFIFAGREFCRKVCQAATAFQFGMHSACLSRHGCMLNFWGNASSQPQPHLTHCNTPCVPPTDLIFNIAANCGLSTADPLLYQMLVHLNCFSSHAQFRAAHTTMAQRSSNRGAASQTMTHSLASHWPLSLPGVGSGCRPYETALAPSPLAVH